MELDDRKRKILKAIIQNYMQTGEPVGSRTISKMPELSISSATIRNEMSDLEELGYILQPHTSAGRIPSDKGYRFYVNELIEEKKIEVDEFKSLVISRVDRLELVLKQLVKIIAATTDYTALISGPNMNKTKIKFIQLSKVDISKLLIVIVVEGNIINNKMIQMDSPLSEEDILELNILLNTSLNGLSLSDINLSVIQKMKLAAGEHGDIIEIVLREVFEAIKGDEGGLEVYTSGATNIFKYPELASEGTYILDALAEQDRLREVIKEVNASESESGDIKVFIGEESPIQDMKNCSIVTANYELGEGLRGTIGVLGPKRMNYDKVLAMLKSLMIQLDDVFKNEDRSDRK